MYELKLVLIRGCGATSINHQNMPLLYRMIVSWIGSELPSLTFIGTHSVLQWMHCRWSEISHSGVRFHTVEQDSRHTTQNSGVMVVGGENNNFYDVLDEVLDVYYPMGQRVWLFKCRWYDTNNNKSHRKHVELGYKSINTSHFLFINEPVMLAT